MAERIYHRPRGPERQAPVRVFHQTRIERTVRRLYRRIRPRSHPEWQLFGLKHLGGTDYEGVVEIADNEFPMHVAYSPTVNGATFEGFVVFTYGKPDDALLGGYQPCLRPAGQDGWYLVHMTYPNRTVDDAVSEAVRMLAEAYGEARVIKATPRGRVA